MMLRPEFVSYILLALMAMASGLVSTDSAYAVQQAAAGTNSKKTRRQAVATIPYSQLSPQTRAKVSAVVDKPSIYRRLPITSIDVDPDMFLFLVRYPEVIVNIWKIMGVTRMEVDRVGPFSLNSNDGAGAISDIELIYGTNNKNIYYAEGTYEGPLLKRKLRGNAVMVLNTEYERGPSGQPKAKNTLDVFVRVENATASLIAKTLNPIVGPTADHNFVESLKFVQRLNETTQQNGVGVQRMANRLTDVQNEVRQNFSRIAGVVYERAASTPTATKANQQPPAIRTGSRPAQSSSGQIPTRFIPKARLIPFSFPRAGDIRQAGFEK